MRHNRPPLAPVLPIPTRKHIIGPRLLRNIAKILKDNSLVHTLGCQRSSILLLFALMAGTLRHRLFTALMTSLNAIGWVQTLDVQDLRPEHGHSTFTTVKVYCVGSLSKSTNSHQTSRSINFELRHCIMGSFFFLRFMRSISPTFAGSKSIFDVPIVPR
ncbi:hypothetical protein BYT27DRAFT_6753418 [Phlegmacium glaucopus]|nr:hypothetical protein BYT27DRAFT_6753418 [Phlegmacium glaucopus]